MLVEARLTNKQEIYPHRPHLATVPMWRCDRCGNYVGCHDKTATPTMPLGSIPTPELRAERVNLHKLIDPIWRSGRMSRKQVYNALSNRFGRQYHTADVRSMEEAQTVRQAVADILNG